MIISALISECRREFDDVSKSTRVSRAGDGVTTLFNTASFPIIEGSYSVKKGTSAQAETTDYAINLDNGDVQFVSAPANTYQTSINFKTATWRDVNWNDAIGNAIDELNARGFFRQIVRNNTIMSLSGNVRTYSGPSACVDLYEVLGFDDRTTSGTYAKLPGNWSYQQDANKLVLGWNPSNAEKLSISYLRNLQKYSATSATLDVLPDWYILLKKKAGANFYRSLAAKVAKQGNATIDEGHFSFTNLRAMANDLDNEFNTLALRKKPTRPAKSIQFYVGGVIES